MQKKVVIAMISIIILNYNAGQLLIDCVDSIINSNLKEFEIILVDNASVDSSHLKCKEKFNDIELISNKENFSQCDCILVESLLNIDVG